MKGRTLFLMLTAIASPCALSAQTASHAQFVGVWRGQMDNLPAITLNITNEGGGLSGAVLFYFLERATVHDPYTSTPGIPEPLFNPRIEGKSLVFEVSHRRAHPPRTLSDPPVHFRMTLMDSDKAELVNETEKSGPPLVLIRAKY
jgi:hypothetical protein